MLNSPNKLTRSKVAKNLHLWSDQFGLHEILCCALSSSRNILPLPKQRHSEDLMANATRPSATFPTIDNALRAPTFRRSRPCRVLGLVVAAALAGESGLAFAAELEEIIVTAQKREENTMDVPAAVSVLSASALERLGVANFNDVARISPSITIEQGANSNNNTIRMRGIGTYSYSIGIEPSVSVVIDDVAVVRQAQA
ncbi:MAG TPA: TonB-dependent receptor plug domain-containing protein, partial [Pseudomonadales bacterium]|nr:TonB-dependent receptor plug domain-containing protein [Pseudomonadales bacterium]